MELSAVLCDQITAALDPKLEGNARRPLRPWYVLQPLAGANPSLDLAQHLRYKVVLVAVVSPATGIAGLARTLNLLAAGVS